MDLSGQNCLIRHTTFQRKGNERVPITMDSTSCRTEPGLLFDLRIIFEVPSATFISGSSSPTTMSPSTSTSTSLRESSTFPSGIAGSPSSLLLALRTIVQPFFGPSAGATTSDLGGYELGFGGDTCVYEKASVEDDEFDAGLGIFFGNVLDCGTTGRAHELVSVDRRGSSESDVLSQASSSPQSAFVEKC